VTDTPPPAAPDGDAPDDDARRAYEAFAASAEHSIGYERELWQWEEVADHIRADFHAAARAAAAPYERRLEELEAGLREARFVLQCLGDALRFADPMQRAGIERVLPMLDSLLALSELPPSPPPSARAGDDAGRAAELTTMLRRLEWVLPLYRGTEALVPGRCQVCGGVRPVHASDCALGALLGPEGGGAGDG
jgi:hypothetical protein